MTDTAMTIIGIVLAVLIMFIFPVVAIASEHDRIAQSTVEAVVADFVNKVAEKGKITEFDYSDLIQKIHATGNTFDVQIELQVLDDNPERKTVTTAPESEIRGENLYYSVYTEDITEKLRNEIAEKQEYNLKKDDYLIVTVKNTNISIGTQFKNFFYKMIGKDTYTIGASSTALVTNTGEEVEKKTDAGTAKVEFKEKKVNVYVINTSVITKNTTFVIDITGSMGTTTTAMGYASRMEMVRSEVKAFLQSINLPDTEDPENTIINVIRFGTTSDIMSGLSTVNTQSELDNLLNNGWDTKLHQYISAFQSYENYDLALEDALKCVKQNRRINSKQNLVIFITDGQHAYNSSYCRSHHGDMTEYGQKLINEEGAIVYAVGIGKQTDSSVLSSIVLKQNSRYKLIYSDSTGTSKLDVLLNEIKSEIKSEADKVEVTSVNGKLLLEKLDRTKPITLTINERDYEVGQAPLTASNLIVSSGGEYYLDLKILANIMGKDNLNDVSIEIHYHSTA